MTFDPSYGLLSTMRKPHVRANQADMLDAIREVGGIAAMEDVAEHFDIHPSTCRTHLDGLVVQGKLRLASERPLRIYETV